MISITDCVNDFTSKVESVGELGVSGNVKLFSVYSEEDLLSKSKLVKFPAAGIMYEGLRSNSNDPTKQGLTADVYITLVLLLSGGAVGGIDPKNEAARMLDAIRRGIHQTKSPAARPWRFIAEIPAGQMGNAVAYLQKWSTQIVIT